MTKDTVSYTHKLAQVLLRTRATDPKQNNTVCLPLASLPYSKPTHPNLREVFSLLACLTFSHLQCSHLFQLLRIFKNEFKSNDPQKHTVFITFRAINFLRRLSDQKRGEEKRKKTKAFLDHIKLEVTRWQLVFISPLHPP